MQDRNHQTSLTFESSFINSPPHLLSRPSLLSSSPVLDTKKEQAYPSSRRGSSSPRKKKTECPQCLSYILPRHLDKHMKYECEARVVRCRFYLHCMCGPFPLNEREEHERLYCAIARKNRKILQNKRGPLPCSRCGSTQRPHTQCPNESVTCPHCSQSMLRCELNSHVCPILVKREELARLHKVHATEKTTCPICGDKDILRKNLHKHQVKECPMRLISCPKCDESVPFQNLSSHLSTRCK